MPMAEYPAPILKPPCDSRTPAVICYALAAVLLAVGLTGGWFARGCVKVKPVVVATTAETTYTTLNDTTTITSVSYRPDPAAVKRVQQLEAELAGTAKSLNDLLNYTGDLQTENRVLVDSVTFYRLRAVAKMLAVAVDRGALTATTLDGRAVSTWRGRAWGPRWTLYADGPNGKPRLQQPRFPFAVGIEAALTGTTRVDSLTPGATLAAHITARRGGWMWFAGAGWPLGSEPKIEAGLRLGWEF
jgi:hypothetical protein